MDYHIGSNFCKFYVIKTSFILDELGQNEPVAKRNALVGCSVHWMGCVFSFDARWGSYNPFLFYADHYICFLILGRFPLGIDLTHCYPTHFPTPISTAPILVPYLLSPTYIATLILIIVLT